MPSLPAASLTLTLSVPLPVRVWPTSDQAVCPTVVVAAVQVVPLSSETWTVSPATIAADRVPLIVCAAVFVRKSLSVAPFAAVSAEKAAVTIVVSGGVMSGGTTSAKVSTVP